LEIKDKAGLASVVADHLSRLGPEATPREEIPIDDSFPDEQLLAISHQATPWYVDLVNFKVCGVYHWVYLINKERSSSPMPITLYGKNLFCTSYVGMGSIEDACQKRRYKVSYTIAILLPMVDTLELRRPLLRSSKRVSIGRQCSKMQ